MTTKHILVVEDEERIATLIAKYLELEGYQFTCVHSGSAALKVLQSQSVDLCILDVMLPGMNGLELCAEVRNFSHIPIIFLSARVEEVDKLLGFKQGADDYMVKPFSPKELMARVAALLKRTALSAAPVPHLQFKSLRVDVPNGMAYYQQSPLKLTMNEFNILKTLMEQPSKVFSRQELLLAVKQHEHAIYERTIDSHIKNLRRKLAQAAPQQEFIQSIYGMGYTFAK